VPIEIPGSLGRGKASGLGYDDLSAGGTESALLLRLLLDRNRSEEKWLLSSYGGVAQLVERLTGSQEVRGFESHRLHSKSQVRDATGNLIRSSSRRNCNQSATRRIR
jgi:hypothetical protein